MIHFVGAGSGAVDLITVRGARYLEEADIIIYAGSLVNPDLLSYAKEDCEIYNSAKMTLEEVMEVIHRGLKENKQIVRLHTGDSSIYGAVREQFDLLDREDIEYDVTPGVSSFCGAAASLKAEFTLPEQSQTVIISRMEGRTPVPERESLNKLASHRSTMVLFLSAGMTDKVREKLLEGGYAEDTPAAIVYKATWPDEKKVYCTVGTLHQAAEENGIRNLALLIIGDCLGENIARSRLYAPDFSTGFRKATE